MAFIMLSVGPRMYQSFSKYRLMKKTGNPTVALVIGVVKGEGGIAVVRSW